MNSVLLVCQTCGYNEQEPDVVRRGEMLARGLEHAIAELSTQANSAALPTLQRYSCLMACKRHCVVQLRAQGKLGYVIGDFAPDAEAIETLLDYSRKYVQSASGQVPYRDWPEAIKGKFLARIPVLEF